MGDVRYSLELIFGGTYREQEVGMDSPSEIVIGTTKNCVVRLPSELFFSDFEISLVRDELGEWKIFGGENNYLSDDNMLKLRMVSLTHGSRFSVHYQNGDTEICHGEFLRSFSTGYTNYTSYVDLSGISQIEIGGNTNCQILIRDEAVGKDSITFCRSGNNWRVVDHRSRYGLAVNGTRIEDSAILYDYDFFSIAGHSFFLNENHLYMCNDPMIQAVGLRILEHSDSKSSMIYPYLNKSTRLFYQIPTEEIEYIDPPEKSKERKQNLFMMILPSLAMLTMIIFLRGVLPNLFDSSGVSKGFAGNAFILFSAGSMSVAIITSIINYKSQKKQSEEDEMKRVESYSAYAQKKEEEIIGKRNEEALLMEMNTPAIAETMQAVWDFNGRLFERSETDEDFLSVRIGTGAVPSRQPVKYSKKERLSIEDEMVTWPETIAKKYEYLPQAPILLPLKEVNMVGIVGNGPMVYEHLKVMITDLCVRHSFQDLQMGLIFPKKDYAKWEWIKWLPHFNNEVTGMRNIAYDDISYKVFAENLYKILSDRENDSEEPGGSRKAFKTHYVIFVTESYDIMRHPVSRFFTNGTSVGVTFVFCNGAEELLPDCDRIIRLGSDVNQLVNSSDAGNVQLYTAYGIQDVQVKRIAEKLACVVVDEVSLESQLTKSITLFHLLGIYKADDLDIKKRWAESKVYKSIAVPMGVDAKNEVVYLDLHEKAHGPHGLVAGTTGSGKSEFLQTYILSMATLFHPYEVSFVIIDFKGGGMVNQFRELPHLAGSITDIDGREIDRSLLSIHAELNKRKELFALAGVNQIDAYIRKYRAGEVRVPLPHLILIVDEFAELKADQPEFMKELISTARIGRSLGIHLILATQKPSGVVDAQIWSNSRFRVCLKVATTEDSKEMLKNPLAAEIREPGRAYLQVGNDEIFELFQSAYSGGSAESEISVGQRDYEIDKIALNGGREEIFVSRQEKKQGEEVTQLQSIVEYIHNYCEESGIPHLPGICLPSLEMVIRTDEINYSCRTESISVPVGIYDDPEQQLQEPVNLEVSKDNIYIVGSSQMGKTVLLQTIIYGLMRRYTSEEVNLYLVDCGSMVLKIFENAPHVGGVVLSNESEKCKNLFKLLFHFVTERKKVLSASGVGNYAAYLEAGHKDMPMIVVAIDNFAAFKEFFPNETELIGSLSREAIGVGISLVVTAATANALSYRVLANFGVKLALNCNDPNEYGNIFGHCRTTPRENPGRGLLLLDKRILEWQAAIFGKSDKEAERSKELMTFLNTLTGPKARVIPVIPEQPEWKMYCSLASVLSLASTGDYLPFGYDQETADVYGINLKKTYTYIIGGKGRTGKTNALKIAAYSADMIGAEVVIFDFENEFRSVAKEIQATYIDDRVKMSEFFTALFPEFLERNKLKQECLAEGLSEEALYRKMGRYGKKVFIVGNLPEFAKKIRKGNDGVKDVSGFVQNVLDKGARHNIYWFAGLNYDGIADVQSDKTYLNFVKEKVGAHFGGNGQDQRIMQFPNIPYSALTRKLKPGIALLSAHEGDETDTVVVPLLKTE